MNFIDNISNIIPELSEHLDKMKDTIQDPIFHSEGDVYIHTLLVLEEVEKLSIGESDKEILRYVALFHDIGKSYCTKEEDGEIRSHGHSRYSYHITRRLLENTNLSFDDKIQIINLIKYHGRPLWVIEKEEPAREVIQMSLDCNNELLYHFAKCDFLGRKCDDLQSKLEDIEYFKIICEELDCFNKPYTFINNITKFNYIVKKTHSYLDNAYDDTKSKVYIMCGLPGTGKDYYIKNNLDIPVISLDDIRKELKIKATDNQGRVIQEAKERAKKFLRIGKDFVWNSTNTTKRMREGLINLFKDYKSYITIIHINTTINIILEQNKNRDEIVPEKVINKLHRAFDIPLNIEAHEVIHIK